MVVWARETISSIETRTTLWSLLQNNDANSNTAVCLNYAYNDSSNTTSTATNEEAEANKAYCNVLHTYTHIHTHTNGVSAYSVLIFRWTVLYTKATCACCLGDE